MLSNTPNLNNIIKDLDSLVYRKKDYSSFQTFHDGVFLIYPDDEDENFYPHRIDISYYSKLKQFKKRFTPHLSDTIKCGFWYEIDTLGNVSNIDIYHHASKEIDSLVVEFYKSFKYNPANNGQKRVMFRDSDYIHFRGTSKE